ncbi:cytochrome c family protein, partial [Bordetella parapertussis]|nr:cytochrome c family protein [Bordetella parapertussis]
MNAGLAWRAGALCLALAASAAARAAAPDPVRGEQVYA